MKPGLVQYNPLWENKEENKNKIRLLLSALDNNPDILIFPEMTLTGFTMNPSQFAEETDGNTFQFFSSIAKEKYADVFAGIIEKDNQKYFNSLLHINCVGKLVNIYRKIHPYSCSGEDKNYSAGNSYVITQIKNMKFGLSICYDLRFPELFRYYGKERVDAIINIANWPVPRIEHYRALLKARAIENQCYAIGVNRVGNDTGHEYNGFSSVFDPMGKELITSENKEEILIAEIDSEKVKQVRTQLPFLEDIKLI